MIFMVFWVVCSVLSYIVGKDYFIRQYPWTRGDRRFVSFMSIFGPITLLAVSILWLVEFGPKGDGHEVLEESKWK